MHISTCLLQDIQGQLRRLGIGTLNKTSTMHQTHQCVLSSLPRARALKDNQDLSHRYQGTNCRHLNKGSPAEHFLPTLQVHVWTVTQDALVRECEVYCAAANSTSTMTLMLQPFQCCDRQVSYFQNQASTRQPVFEGFQVSQTKCSKHLLSNVFTCTLTLIVPQNLNVMAPELPM